MRRLHLCILIGVLFFAAITVFAILKGADLPNKKKNGFNRSIYLTYSEPEFSKFVGSHVRRICGYTDKLVYFSGNDPGWVLSADHSLSSFDTIYLPVKGSERFRDPTTTVEYPYIYMYATEVGYFMWGRLDSLRNDTLKLVKIDTLKLETEVITRVAQISRNKLVTRGIDSTQSKQIFNLLDANNGHSIKQEEVIKGQQFGGFETDGILKTDPISKYVLFVQNYQNSIFCLDSNLNIVSKFHTIDTIYSNNVEIGLAEEGGITKIMAKKPRVIVNQLMDVSNDALYIISGLRSDREKLSEFNRYSPLDVYRVKGQRYIGSVTLPKLNGSKIRDFRVIASAIVVIYQDGNIASYKFNISELPIP